MRPPHETRFSVVIPCRNERERLASCLDALEGQDHPGARIEIIVVDGHSEDGSGAIAVGRGVRLLSDPGRGPAGARNVGIRAARGDIVAFTDADCVPRFDWLTRIAEAFEAHPDAGGVAGALRLPRASLLGRLEDNDARVLYEGYITSNVAYRRDLLHEVGGFDESLVCAEDYDLAWRVMDAGHRIVREPRAVVLHDPPEVEGTVGRYLAKQFWYARHDVPAHARAIGRSWRADGTAPGSGLAFDGLRDALRCSAAAIGVAAGFAARSRLLAAAALGATSVAAYRQVSRVVERVGEGAREAPLMSLIETAKRVTRGAGTLVGLADLARPSVARQLRRAAPSPWPSAPPLRQRPA